MSKTFLLLALSTIVTTAMAQKKITCKKGDVKQEGQLIAEYDGVGSIFKMVKLGVFAPGTKDTLISVTEESFDPKNPLFPDVEVAYKVEFKNTTQQPFYVHNPKNPGTRYMERDAMEMIFNDTVPAMISNARLDLDAVEKFRAMYAYDLNKVRDFVKAVEDSIAIINKVEIARDRTKPVTLKIFADNSNQFETNQVFDIYQDNIVIGRAVKKVTIGSFPKASYTFWKPIEPITINGIDMKRSPVAFCSSGATSFDIPVTAVVGKTEYKIKGAFNALELQIANLLVGQKLL
jgi:hypothetical protein